jgi:hypothetical protein
MLRTAERGKAFRTFPRNQGIEASVHDSCLLANSREFLRLLEKLVVNDQRRSHMHEYALLMHISQQVRVLQPDQRRKFGAGFGENRLGDSLTGVGNRSRDRVDATNVARQHFTVDSAAFGQHYARAERPHIGCDRTNDDETARAIEGARGKNESRTTSALLTSQTRLEVYPD